MIWLTLLLGFIGLLLLYFRKKHNYFKDAGIPHAPGYFPFGSSLVWKCFSGKESLLQVADDYFDQFPETKAFGFYKPFGVPVLAIKDLELARKIMNVKNDIIFISCVSIWIDAHDVKMMSF